MSSSSEYLISTLWGSTSIYSTLARWILKAQKTIHYVCWTCDFESTPILKGKWSLWPVLQMACDANPNLQVFITLKENPLHPILWSKECQEQLQSHPQIHLFFCCSEPQSQSSKDSEEEPNLFSKSLNFVQSHFRSFYKNNLSGRGGKSTLLKTIYEHLSPSEEDFYQSYLVMDQKHILFGGTDIQPSPLKFDFFSSSSSSKSSKKKTWVDVCLKLKHVNPSWCQQLIRNAKDPFKYTSLLRSPFVNSQLAYPNSEEDVLVQLVQNAQDYVCFFHEFFFSTTSTENRICQTIIKKLKQRRKDSPNIKILILTNWNLFQSKDDSDSDSDSDSEEEEEEEEEKGGFSSSLLDTKENVIQKLIRVSVTASFLSIKQAFSNEEWSDILDNHLFFGCLRNRAYIHSKICFVDNQHLLFSHSSITDGALCRPIQRIGLKLIQEKDTVLFFCSRLSEHLLNQTQPKSSSSSSSQQQHEKRLFSFSHLWDLILQDANQNTRVTKVENLYCKLKRKYRSLAKILMIVNLQMFSPKTKKEAKSW